MVWSVIGPKSAAQGSAKPIVCLPGWMMTPHRRSAHRSRLIMLAKELGCRRAIAGVALVRVELISAGSITAPIPAGSKRLTYRRTPDINSDFQPGRRSGYSRSFSISSK